MYWIPWLPFICCFKFKFSSYLAVFTLSCIDHPAWGSGLPYLTHCWLHCTVNLSRHPPSFNRPAQWACGAPTLPPVLLVFPNRGWRWSPSSGWLGGRGKGLLDASARVEWGVSAGLLGFWPDRLLRHSPLSTQECKDAKKKEKCLWK